PETGNSVAATLAGHTDWVRTLAVWQNADRTVLISGSYDKTIRVWDGETGAPVGSPLEGPGRVGALTVWTENDGGGRLAAAGDDGTIRMWNLDTLESLGEPLIGHSGGIWALTKCEMGDRVWLASAGQDGSVWLWDPRTRHAIRTMEIGPVAIWGLSDFP